MKNKHSSAYHSAKLLAPLFSFAAFLLIACNSGWKKTESFYYSGNKKIEIIIIGDTLGVLLKDTILNPATTPLSYFEDVKKAADSGFITLSYTKAGNLEKDQFIQLLINDNKKKTPKALEAQARELKSAANKNFISNAGYLVRIKGSNKAMILTDEIIIQFKSGTTPAKINAVFQEKKLRVVRKSPFDSLQYTVATTKDSPADALKISHQLKGNTDIEYAQMNFIYVKRLHSVRPNDPLFDNQWTLSNIGNDADNAAEDSDVDADKAWDYGLGSESTVLAIIDVGFDIDHYELAPNLLPGWNFNGDDNNLIDLLGHGTAVSGIAIGVGNNNTGIIGICPQCKAIPIKSGHAMDQDAYAISFAIARGAKIINCSWDYGTIQVPPNVIGALRAAIAANITIVFSVANENENYCAEIPELLEFPSLIFVSRSTSKDTYDSGGWGDCLSLLAPAGVYGSPAGFLKQYTTDVLSWGGYNDGTNDKLCTPAYFNPDFTSCFFGTSASAPLTSGVAGLILSAQPNLTPMQVKYLLQDCADKIEESKGKYDKLNGKSTTNTHGYGRLNAYEAVRIASSNVAEGGGNGVDIFFRDNELDWGNTEKPTSYSFEPGRPNNLAYWKSMDIKVDAPPYTTAPATMDNTFFESLNDENPIGGQNNKVYVRVRNRGYRTASNVSVKLHWVHAGAALPALPSDFWARFPADPLVTSDWNSLGVQSISNLEYSGASLANTGSTDKAQITVFDFLAPVHDPSTRNHYCLMALITSPDDRMPTSNLLLDPENLNMDHITQNYNNATHRNYNIETGDAPFAAEFRLHNPLPYSINTMLAVSYKGEGIPVFISDSLTVRPVFLKKNESRLVKININPKDIKSPTEIEIRQIMMPGKKSEQKTLGGINYLIMPGNKQKK